MSDQVTDVSWVETVRSPRSTPAPGTRRMADYLARIVEAGTAWPVPGRLMRSPLPCRRRPGRRPCSGRLTILTSEVPDEIRWRCPSCGDAGLLTGWRGSELDLSRLPIPGEESAGRVAAFIEAEDLLFLADCPWLDDAVRKVLRAAEVKDGEAGVVVPLPFAGEVIDALNGLAYHDDPRVVVAAAMLRNCIQSELP